MAPVSTRNSLPIIRCAKTDANTTTPLFERLSSTDLNLFSNFYAGRNWLNEGAAFLRDSKRAFIVKPLLTTFIDGGLFWALLSCRIRVPHHAMLPDVSKF